MCRRPRLEAVRAGNRKGSCPDSNRRPPGCDAPDPRAWPRSTGGRCAGLSCRTACLSAPADKAGYRRITRGSRHSWQGVPERSLAARRESRTLGCGALAPLARGNDERPFARRSAALSLSRLQAVAWRASAETAGSRPLRAPREQRPRRSLARKSSGLRDARRHLWPGGSDGRRGGNSGVDRDAARVLG